MEPLILLSEHSDNDAIKSFMGFSSRLLYLREGMRYIFVTSDFYKVLSSSMQHKKALKLHLLRRVIRNYFQNHPKSLILSFGGKTQNFMNIADLISIRPIPIPSQQSVPTDYCVLAFEMVEADAFLAEVQVLFPHKRRKRC